MHSYKLAFSLRLGIPIINIGHLTEHKYSFRVLVNQWRAAFSNQHENHSVLPTPTTFYPAPLRLQTMDITIIIIIIAHTQCSILKTFSAHIIILYLPITPIHIYIIYVSAFTYIISKTSWRIPRILSCVYYYLFFVLCSLLYLLLKRVLVYAKLFNPKQIHIRSLAFAYWIACSLFFFFS